MRLHAPLGALVGLARLSNAAALSSGQDGTSCPAEVTETVYVTVPPAVAGPTIEATILSLSIATESLSEYPVSMPTSAPLGPSSSVSPYESSSVSTSAPSLVPSLGPIAVSPAPVVSPGTIVTTETYTLSSVGAGASPVVGTITLTQVCPGGELCSKVGSAAPTGVTPPVPNPNAIVSTFLLTTTITSGYTPQVVETETYTVIETLGSPAAIASPTFGVSHSLSTLPGSESISRPMSTASFTLTLTSIVPATTLPAPTSGATGLPGGVSSYGSEPSVPAITPSSVPHSVTIFTVTLPGGLGATPEVITITATAPAVITPATPAPSIITLTTTVSSGSTEVSLTPSAPVTTDVVMTYTVTAPDGRALTTMIMTTPYIYTPEGGVGTPVSTVSTVTEDHTVTVVATTPGPQAPLPRPFPNTTASVTGSGYNFTTTPIASVPAVFSTITINGSAVATSIIVPLNTTTLIGAVPPDTISTFTVNGSAVETIVPVVPTLPSTPSPTELPPFPTNNNTESPLPPSGTAPPPNGTAPATTSVSVPVNSTTTVALPLTTNGTSPGVSPTPPANGTTSASPPANQTTSGNAGPVSTPVNGTTPAPTANQTASQGQGGHGGQGAPTSSASLNSTGPTPTSNHTSSVPAQSQGGQGGKSQGAPSSSAPAQSQGQGQGGKSQGAPSSSAPAQSQGQGQGGKSQGAPSSSAPAQSQGQGQGGKSQGAPSSSAPAQSQGQGQGQGQGGKSSSAPAQSQGGQGQSQGGQGQGQSQGGQGQSQGGQGKSQGGQGQGQSQQGGGGFEQTALGLPNPTGVPGQSQVETVPAQPAATLRSAPGMKARAVSPQPTATANATCDSLADQDEVIIDFDDLPTFQIQMAPGSSASDLSPIGIYSPYHRLTWSEGFRAFPASVCPFQASSGELMVEHLAPSPKAHKAAEIGLGPLQAEPCFRFDFTSFRVGCASTGAPCKFNVTGLSWDHETYSQVPVVSHQFHTRACLSQKHCKLGLITADKATGLTNLTSLLIDVTASGKPETWWADDLVLTWTDTSCDTAVCRSRVRDTVSKRGRRHGMSLVLDTLP